MNLTVGYSDYEHFRDHDKVYNSTWWQSEFVLELDHDAVHEYEQDEYYCHDDWEDPRTADALEEVAQTGHSRPSDALAQMNLDVRHDVQFITNTRSCISFHPKRSVQCALCAGLRCDG